MALAWYDDDAPEDFLPVDRYYGRYADYLRHVGGFDPIFGRIMDLCGFETGLMHMAQRPDLVHAMVAHIGAFLEEYYRRLANDCQGHVDFVGFGDDFADQRSMLISPEKWREYFLPTWRRLFDVAHASGLRVSMHMCGAVRPILGDLIDAGLDVFEVVQVTAKGMDPAELKDEFGHHLAFYGGLDTQQTLPLGSPVAVRREVRRMVHALGSGGRYVLASMHFLMNDVSVQNVLAMYDEARSYVPGVG